MSRGGSALFVDRSRPRFELGRYTVRRGCKKCAAASPLSHSFLEQFFPWIFDV
jgi:hypothetical protein